MPQTHELRAKENLRVFICGDTGLISLSRKIHIRQAGSKLSIDIGVFEGDVESLCSRLLCYKASSLVSYSYTFCNYIDHYASLITDSEWYLVRYKLRHKDTKAQRNTKGVVKRLRVFVASWKKYFGEMNSKSVKTNYGINDK